MEFTEIDTIQFVDMASGDQAVAIVRAGADQVALCLSVAHGDDLEVILGRTACESLLKAIHQAIAVARGNGSEATRG
jgi:hypothetical protein